MAPTYNIQVNLNPAAAQAGGRQIQIVLNHVAQSAQNTTQQVSRLEQQLRRLANVYVAASAARFVLQQINTYQELTNKVRLVTSSQEELAVVTEHLFDISNRTRASLEETSRLYARLKFNTEELGLSQRQVLQLTETLNNILLISGATSREAATAMQQFSQAMSKGRLDGDELKTILEVMPPIADALSKSLGVTRGELRKMGEEGKLTGKVVFEALQKYDALAKEQAAKTTPTLAQSWTLFGNAVLDSIGKLDQFLGVSNALSSVLKFMGETITYVTNAFLGFFDSRQIAFQTLTVLIDLYGSLTDVLIGLYNVLTSMPGVDLGASAAVAVVGQTVARARNDAIRLQVGIAESLDEDKRAKAAAERGLDKPGTAAKLPPTKEQEKYSEILRRANAELDKQNQLLLVSEERREVLGKLLDIEERFQRNKTPILSADKDALEARITAVQQLTKVMGALEDATKTVFKGMEDAVVNFVETGKFEFKRFADQVVSDLVRIALQAYVTKPLVNAAMGGISGAFGSIFGGASAPAGGSTGTVTPNLPKFATGGSFSVGGSGGTDSKLVAFMASPGEKVRVDPPGKGGGGNVQVNITTPAGTEARTEERDQGGVRIVDVVISTVNKALAQGSFDQAMGGRFGAQPVGKRR